MKSGQILSMGLLEGVGLWAGWVGWQGKQGRKSLLSPEK